jgi:tetratricopeptide (TPR) repeat protein/tRNA A-37 threonylcarbamoyl transferase component Bud32
MPTGRPRGGGHDRYLVVDEMATDAHRVVVRAYDTWLQREVLVESLPRERFESRELDRLIDNGRAVARLNHPHVVSVFGVEAGADGADGPILLVMEHVRGQTLRQWLSGGSRGWRDIVSVFMAAGLGLAAAHRSDVVHGAFDASCVRVDNLDARPSDRMIKVGDFSLREATAGPAGDQQAFCSALLEALGGSEATGVPEGIISILRRGVDDSPDQRWPSMGQLLDALERELEPRKTVRVLQAVPIVAGIAAIWALSNLSDDDERCQGATEQLQGTWDETRAAEIRDALGATDLPFATATEARVQQQLDVYASQWSDAYRDACEATTIRREQDDDALALRMTCLSRAKRRLEATVDVLALGDQRTVGNVDKVLAGLRPVETCSDVDALRRDPDPVPQPLRPAAEEVELRLDRGRAAVAAGQFDLARRWVDEAKAQAESLELPIVALHIAAVEASVEEREGHIAEAEARLRRTFSDALAQRRIPEAVSAAHDLASTLLNYGQRTDVAARWVHVAVALGEDVRGGDLMAASLRATLALEQGRLEDAERGFRGLLDLQRAHGVGVLEQATTTANIGLTLLERGEYGQALEESRAAIALREQVVGTDHPNVAESRSNLAGVFYAQGRLDEAEAEQRRAVEIFERALGADHPEALRSRNNLGSVLQMQGRYDEAEAEFRRVLAGQRKQLGDDNPSTSNTRHNLANCLHMSGRSEEAVEEHQRALDGLLRAVGEEHRNVARYEYSLALSLAATDRQTEALVMLERAWALTQKTDHPPDFEAMLAFELAQKLATPDADAETQSRARTLAEFALRTFASLGAPFERHRDEVQRWLAAGF